MNNNTQDRKDNLKQNPRPNQQSEQKQTPKQQPEKQEKDGKREGSAQRNAPKPNIPDYGDRPEQIPTVEDGDGGANNTQADGKKQKTSTEQ